MKNSDAKKHLIKVLPLKSAFFCDESNTVLDAALSAGLPLPHSCRGGNCGSCMARVNSGQYLYQHEIPPLGISDEQREQGHVLLCQIQPRSELSITVRAPASSRIARPVLQLPCRLVSRERVAKDVMKIFLQLPRSQPLEFTPGQYLDILLERGQRRSYSMASLPHPTAPLELHIRRVEKGRFSDQLFAKDSTMNLLRIEGPYGEFGWRDGNSDVVMVAGGTGYAPLKAILQQVLPKLSSRMIYFYWGGRDLQDLYEFEQLQQWAREYPNFVFRPCVEQADESNTEIYSGLAHQAVLAQHADLSDFEIYASGPPAMINTLRQDFIVAGADPQRLYCDAFDYAC